MFPILYEQGSIIIRTHSAVMILAYALGIVYAATLWQKYHGTLRYAPSFLTLCLVTSLLGGRVMTVLENFEAYGEAPIEALKLWKSGYGSLGSWIFTILGATIYLKLTRFSIGKVLDNIVIPTGMLAYGFGRLACFFAGDVYGKISTLPFAVTYTNPRSSIPPVFLGFPLHPLPLYESLIVLSLDSVSEKSLITL